MDSLDRRLDSLLSCVQTDPGQRGLARIPGRNLISATTGDFSAACKLLHSRQNSQIRLVTGFYIPSSEPPAFETDGPLGAVFLARALTPLGYQIEIEAEEPVLQACAAVLKEMPKVSEEALTLAIERGGPAADGLCRTMRGLDITPHLSRVNQRFEKRLSQIGIGDGGNEVGMGKIPHDIIVDNIPGGDMIHCRIGCEHLIVAGVSNWGAYALAAGVWALSGQKMPSTLLDPDAEQKVLEAMVAAGPLVDGVTGQFKATVDGLDWAAYSKPLVEIRSILES